MGSLKEKSFLSITRQPQTHTQLYFVNVNDQSAESLASTTCSRERNLELLHRQEWLILYRFRVSRPISIVLMRAINPISRCRVALTLLLVLAIEQSLTARKLSAGTLVTAKRISPWARLSPSQGQVHRNEARDQEMQRHRELLRDTTPTWYHNAIFKINRGGGDASKIEECSTKVITIGVVEVSKMASNRPDLYSSIVLVVEDDAQNDYIEVDEILEQRNHFPLLQEKENSSLTKIKSERAEEDTKATLESLALLCDILVVRIGEEETLGTEFISSLMCGNRQREATGMAGGKHWLSVMKGINDVLRPLTGGSGNNKDDDKKIHSNKTSWSTLFPHSKARDENEKLKYMFASLSQQTIQSKQKSIAKLMGATTKISSDFFPPVSVLRLNKQSTHGFLQSDEAMLENTQTSSEFNRVLRQKNQHQGNDEIVGNVIGMAYRRLEELEEKMQELVLDQSSNRMPMLQFGSLVQEILHATDIQLKQESGMNESFRRGLMKGIIVEVQRLYKDQLQALRNYYGQRYESILDEDAEDDTDDDESIERRWAAGAEYLTQAFVAAAQNSVPAMYRTDLKNAPNKAKTNSEVSFNHVDVLQGLIRDMIESTERRKDERSVATIIEEDVSDSKPTSARKLRLPQVPKWLERLAARAFVFGVNYFQGWLAWQGIKRAALERDRNMPKFPLF